MKDTQVATKADISLLQSDLKQLEQSTKADLESVRAELKADIKSVRK